MNSFIGIANTNTTNLAVVAPGIAEALLATGLGLFAAIPSVIFYNYFQTRHLLVRRAVGRVRGRADERDLPAARQGGVIQMAAKLSSGGGGRYSEDQNGRDQCHALRGRDAGPADHLHGGRTTGERDRQGRASAGGRQAGGQPSEARSTSRSSRAGTCSSRTSAPTWPSLGDDLRKNLGEKRNPEKERIFIRADKDVLYGDFMGVMNMLQDNGFYSVALVGEDNNK
jgi:hypothetical protein